MLANHTNPSYRYIVPSVTEHPSLWQGCRLLIAPRDAGSCLDISPNKQPLVFNGSGLATFPNTEYGIVYSSDTIDTSFTTSGYSGVQGSGKRSAFVFGMPHLTIATDTQSDKATMFGLTAPVSNGARWNFRINSIVTHGNLGALRIEIGGGYVVGTTTITGSTYHAMGYSFPGGSLTNAELYLDGVIEAFSGNTDRIVESNTAAQMKVLADASVVPERGWFGKILVVAYWDRYLSAQEQRILADDPFIMIKPNWENYNTPAIFGTPTAAGGVPTLYDFYKMMRGGA